MVTIHSIREGEHVTCHTEIERSIVEKELGHSMFALTRPLYKLTQSPFLHHTTVPRLLLPGIAPALSEVTEPHAHIHTSSHHLTGSHLLCCLPVWPLALPRGFACTRSHAPLPASPVAGERSWR